MTDLFDLAHDLAQAALDTLGRRKGFDWWWDDLEEWKQNEIREAIIDKMVPHLRTLPEVDR